MLQSYFIKLVFRLYFKRIMYYLTQTIADSASILCEIPVNVNVNKGKWLASTYWRKKVVLNSRKTSCFLACLLWNTSTIYQRNKRLKEFNIWFLFLFWKIVSEILKIVFQSFKWKKYRFVAAKKSGIFSISALLA